LEEKIES